MSTETQSALNFTCQQCKQPLQLDPSVANITSSAYDMIAGSLPKSPPTRTKTIASADRMSQLKAPASAKAAWEKSRAQDPSSSSSHSTQPSTSTSSSASPFPSTSTSTSSSTPPRTTVKRKTTGNTKPAESPSVAESFVMLQDSVVKRIPTTPSHTSTPRKGAATPLSPTRRPSGRSTPTPSMPKQASSAVPSSPKPSSRQPSPQRSATTHTISNNLDSTLRLFTLLSSRTELDHPLCADCTNVLLWNLHRQLEETKRQRDGYIAFEKEIKRERESSKPGEEEAMQKRIEKLKREEKEAIDDLRDAEKEKANLEAELAALEEEEIALAEEETEFWASYSSNMLQSNQQTAELNSLKSALRTAEEELEKLSRTNVYNDAFCIGHDGVFGTVNGLRLGRVGGVAVEWSEINAAWGQTLLLLYTIAKKLNFMFENYRLVPMGSFSRIEKTHGDKGVLELYGLGDLLHLGRLLHNRRFDLAMVAFLDCLRQLMEYVRSLDPSFEFPHAIVKDKIGEASIKLQFNQEEVWTRALRHVLVALKLLLKWATTE